MCRSWNNFLCFISMLSRFRFSLDHNRRRDGDFANAQYPRGLCAANGAFFAEENLYVGYMRSWHGTCTGHMAHLTGSCFILRNVFYVTIARARLVTSHYVPSRVKRLNVFASYFIHILTVERIGISISKCVKNILPPLTFACKLFERLI